MGLPKKKFTHSFKSVAEIKQAHEKIADQIRDAIFDKKLHPGEKLPAERELAEIFRTSRVTVRSALLTLKNGGFLKVKQGKNGGAFVAEDIGEVELARLLRDIIGWKDISLGHVIEVRAMIEPQIAYLAAQNAEQKDMDAIWTAINELENLFRTRNKFRGSDENFHKALARAAKNPLLSVIQASLIDVLFKFIYTIAWEHEHKENILLHHKKIAEKVQNRSPEAAMEAMTEHLSDMQFILSRLPAAKTLKWFKD